MVHVFYVLSAVFTVFVCLFAFIVILINLFLALRRRFKISVNCWFCNSWTKVFYESRNNFECPTCLQYNGFNKQGDYNKPIAAQYERNLNQTHFIQNRRLLSPPSNGLCTLCNHNQNLKVHQLAKFVPLQENNYDIEVEHFRKQLEKAYMLCPECQLVLKTTLNHQNLTILGNRVRQLQRRTVTAFDLNKTASNSQNRSSLLKIIKTCLIILAAMILLETVITADYPNLKIKLPHTIINLLHRTRSIIKHIVHRAELMGIFDIFEETITPMKDTLLNVGVWLDNSFNSSLAYGPLEQFGALSEDSVFAKSVGNVKSCIGGSTNIGLASVGGTLLQAIMAVWGHNNISYKKQILLLIFWIILTGFQLGKIKETAVVKVLQVVITSFIILYMVRSDSHTTKTSKPKSKPRKSKIRRMTQEDVFSEESDNEAFQTHQSRDVSFNSTFNSTNTARTGCNCDNLDKSFSPICPQKPTNTASSVISDSSLCLQDQINSDLNAGLSNLFLGRARTPSINPGLKSPSGVFKPVLTAPKLKTVTQNPWIAGGFWNSPLKCDMQLPATGNLSRSSSQSSGFVSQINDRVNYSSLPASRNGSFHGDYERNSVCSEPVRNFDVPQKKSPANSVFKPSLFYPVLNSNQTLYIHSGGQVITSAYCHTPSYYFRGSANMSADVLQRSTDLNNSPDLCGSSSSLSEKLYSKGSLIKNWNERTSMSPTQGFSDIAS